MSQTNTPYLVRHKTTILVWTGVAIILLIAGRQWDSIEAALSRMVMPMSLLALFFLVCANFVASMVFATLASDEAQSGYDRVELSSVFLISQAAKYVPGKIWSVLMQAAYLRGRFTAGMMIIANIEIALLILGVISMIGLGIALWIIPAKLIGVVAPILGILAILLVIRRGPLRQFAFRVFARLANRKTASYAPVRSDGLHVHLSCVYLGLISFGILYLAGWLIFAGPALGIDIQVALRWVGLMSVSYVLGVLSMLPAGIGVREASIYLLAAYLGVDSGQAATIAVLSRVMMLAIDASGILLGSAALMAVNAAKGMRR